jgi:hypothetical protein
MIIKEKGLLMPRCDLSLYDVGNGMGPVYGLIRFIAGKELAHGLLPEVEPAVEMEGIEGIQGIQFNMLYHGIAFVGLLGQEDGFPEGDHYRDMLFPGKMDHTGEEMPDQAIGHHFLIEFIYEQLYIFTGLYIMHKATKLLNCR